jgi:hypothetical protein
MPLNVLLLGTQGLIELTDPTDLLVAGDLKCQVPAGGSPAPGRPQTALSTRDSAELRRQGLSAGAREGRRATPGELGGLDLMLTGKRLAHNHPLLRGAGLEIESEQGRVEEDPVAARASSAEAEGSDDEQKSRLGEEEARILNESWQGSPQSHRSSHGVREATVSSPSSHFASVNASRERSCVWSPTASHITGASVDPMDSATYGDMVDDDTVNQSLNASVASVGSARDERNRALHAEASSRHRGIIAARAMMGRKRVYGAVVIQLWFRKMLHRKKQRERASVKSMLRERRQKKQDEATRRAHEDTLAASVRSEKEKALEAALEQREQEVERATQRLKRSLPSSLPFSAGSRTNSSQRVHSGSEADTFSQSAVPSSPPQKANVNTWHASAASPQSATAARERGDGRGEEQTLMDALRASVERSADLLGFARCTGSPAAHCSPHAASAMSALSARYGIEDEGGLSNDDGLCVDDVRPTSAHQTQTNHVSQTAAVYAPASQHPASSPESGGLSAARRSWLPHSPADSPPHKSPVAPLTGQSELLSRRSVQAPAAVTVVSPSASPSAPAFEQQRTSRQGAVNAAAKELQQSILSFLDSAQGDGASMSASVAFDRAAAPAPEAGSTRSRRALALDETDEGSDETAASSNTKTLSTDTKTLNTGALNSSNAGEEQRQGDVRLSSLQGPRRALALDETDDAIASPPSRVSFTSGHPIPVSDTLSHVLSSPAPSVLANSAASFSASSNGAPLLAAQVYGEVKARMASMKVELDQKGRMIADLTDALNQRKKEAAAQREEHAEHLSSQLALQRLEYEAQAKRQLELLDQLINDKAALTAKCEELAAEFQLLQRKYEAQVKHLQDAHSKELKKQKESMAVSEKIRRDTWMQEKCREIKEMTVKGLQPEIERLLAKHKKEVLRMEEFNVLELQRQRQALAEAHERSMHEVRERMLLERDRAVEREREAASLRMREQSERFDQQLQAQRIRLADDMAQERERLENAHRVERQRVEDIYGMQVKDDSKRLSEMQREWADKEEDLRRRHASELARVREREAIEREEWQKAMNRKLDDDRAAALEAIQKKMELQRDQEIDVVITRLEEEACPHSEKVLGMVALYN